MAYQLFDSKAVKFSSPQLTILRGRIFFNADAGEILAETGAKFVQILWDAEACKVGIRPVAKEDRRAFKLTLRSGRRGGSLSAQAFLNYIQWDTPRKFAVPAVWNRTERVLEAVLPREHVGSSTRRRQGAE